MLFRSYQNVGVEIPASEQPVLDNPGGVALAQADKAVPRRRFQGHGRAGNVGLRQIGIPACQNPDGLLFDQLVGKGYAGGFQGRKGQDAAVKLQNCKKASSVRTKIANLQSGKTTNGGLPRKNSRPRLWCLHC